MDWERRCMRTCAVILLCAVVIRLSASGRLSPLGEVLESPQVASFLVYLQTGRVVRLSAQPEPPTTAPEPESEPTQPATTEAVQPTAPDITAEDLERIDVKYTCRYRPDLSSLLTKPLSFDLKGDEPTVLILHTHTSESYTPTDGQNYLETSEFRTLDPDYNMLRIGDEVAAVLEEAGIRVIHDREFHDYPSYNGSYNDAAKSTANYIEQYPSIRLILDLHRDAADTAYGQMVTECTVGGQSSAQLMMVVGTDGGGLSHPNWQDNLSLALKLQVVLEKQNPGICRNLSLAYQRFNQHFTPGALLIEVGAAGNTLDEALIAANALGKGIVTLFQE